MGRHPWRAHSAGPCAKLTAGFQRGRHWHDRLVTLWREKQGYICGKTQACFSGARTRDSCMIGEAVKPSTKAPGPFLCQNSIGSTVGKPIGFTQQTCYVRWPNVYCLLLGQRRRRWANSKPTLGQCFMLVGYMEVREAAAHKSSKNNIIIMIRTIIIWSDQPYKQRTWWKDKHKLERHSVKRSIKQNIVLLFKILVHRLRRWPNNKQQCINVLSLLDRSVYISADVESTLFRRWSTVYDVEPMSNQHCIKWDKMSGTMLSVIC